MLLLQGRCVRQSQPGIPGGGGRVPVGRDRRRKDRRARENVRHPAQAQGHGEDAGRHQAAAFPGAQGIAEEGRQPRAALLFRAAWPKTADVLKKLKDELDEFNTALTNGNQKKIEEELGDLLFTLVNLSRFIKVDAETALMKTTHKFLQRFSFITDQLVAEGKTPKEATLTEMDALWNKAKQEVIKK
jgi:phosphoribosyl-ATP pyrophosphohydrolase